MSLPLPPTVNMHVVGFCNYKCRFCYARFVTDQQCLDPTVAKSILSDLAIRGVQRVTFAGGEPTLHPQLVPLLAHASEQSLVTSLVTNGSLVERDFARRALPWLRWLVLSCDSAVAATCRSLGRHGARESLPQPDRVRAICRMVHKWNASRSEADRVRLKLNMVVTAENAGEDPTEWIRECAPDRVKLLQCLVVPGENDDAADLACPAELYEAYAARVRCLEREGIAIASERSDDLLDSYAMVDPRGRFRQAHRSGYIHSEPIEQIGVDLAWTQVGGCSLERFVARGGIYEHGAPARGVTAPIIAIEGLDGSGKSTTAQALARALDADVVHSPPKVLQAERVAADQSSRKARRDFYWRANHVAMEHATEHVFMNRTVVMDRCFASTAAYQAAEQGRVAEVRALPPRVTRPDRIVFLDLPEPERRRRLEGRSGLTAEEQRLQDDDAFRERVRRGYLNLATDVIDARGATDEIVGQVGALLRQ